MLKKPPMEGYIKPGRVIGNIYFVGTRPASTHIIDTGDGLILIDPGYRDSLYLVIQNMWELGFNPKDIKIILLSHGHYDHANATAELVSLTGAKVCLGKDDLPFATGEYDHFTTKGIPFDVDVLLSDGDTVELGNVSIRCVSTPGHTDGTMSFFFNVTDGGRTYLAGMFGGAGTNTLTQEFIEKNHLPMENRDKYFGSIERLHKENVEVFLGNHVGNNDTGGKLLLLANGCDKNPFIAPDEWHAFLEKCRATLIKLIESEKMQT